MFETDLILRLQSFSSEWLTTTMVAVSQLSDPRLYIALALIVTFGLDFRLGFALFQMVLWNSALTGLLKGVFGLPRPDQVDSAVRLLGHDTTNATPFAGKDGRHFFDLPERAAIEHYRAQPHVSFGLPSAHVSRATAFWGGAAALLGSGPLAIFGALFVVAMALSRMYLGRHFLADVLGGVVLGLLVVLAIRSSLRGAQLRQLFVTRRALPLSRRHIGIAALLVLAPLLLLLFGAAIRLRSVGELFGANIAFAFLMLRGVPVERTGRSHRLGRIGLALFLYFAAQRTVSWSMGQLWPPGMTWTELLRGMVPPLVVLVGTVQLGSLLGLYGSPPGAAGPSSSPIEPGASSGERRPSPAV
jgi:membrane-associated phospholipid phosphatase